MLWCLLFKMGCGSVGTAVPHVVELLFGDEVVVGLVDVGKLDVAGERLGGFQPEQRRFFVVGREARTLPILNHHLPHQILSEEMEVHRADFQFPLGIAVVIRPRLALDKIVFRKTDRIIATF